MTAKELWIPAIICCLALPAVQCRADATTSPTTRPTDPAATMHAFLGCLDKLDARQARSFWTASSKDQTALNDGQIAALLAMARLKQLVRDKISLDAMFNLNLAVAGDFECGAIDTHVTGDHATLDVHSVDPQSEAMHGGASHFSMVRVGGCWKLVDDNPADLASMKQQPGQPNPLVKGLNAAADGVAAGRLRSADDVMRTINEQLPE